MAGDWHSELHEEAVFRAFLALGHEPFRFSWHQYFKAGRSGIASRLSRWAGKAQNKFMAGPRFAKLNADFVESALRIRPDAIFIYRGTHISRESLQEIGSRLPGTVLVGYNNDDPFAPGQSRLLWRHFMAAVPQYDLMLAYRLHNLDDFRRAGARRVELLRSWFDPVRNHPVTLDDEEKARYGCDVVFVGHLEQDGRVALLEAIAEKGYRLKLYGPGYEWNDVIRKSPSLKHLYPVGLVWGDEYNKALCGAKVALCFLSKLNRDTYTRRCFEIPATETVLFSEYTDDLASLFREGLEADFFRSREELLLKLDRYISDDAYRASVASAGCETVKRERHDVVSRMKGLLETVAELGSAKRVDPGMRERDGN